jgi:5-methylcytosine-specific restriction endonuclease McrA
MPRWRPIGMTRDAIISQDGNDCVLRLVGRCVLPDDTASVIGENVPEALSLDHIMEQAHHGADHRASNLLTVHRQCNIVRGSRPFVKFVGRYRAQILAQLCPRVAPTIMACLALSH